MYIHYNSIYSMGIKMAYVFRITLEDDDFSIYRDIAISPNTSIANFLTTLREAFGFILDRPDEFYICDEEGDKESKITTPELLTLSEVIFEPHQKFYYLFDPNKQFEFQIELLSCKEVQANLPSCIKKVGIAPAQLLLQELEMIKDEVDFQVFLKLKSAIR